MLTGQQHTSERREREASKMQTRRTNWVLVTSLLVAFLNWGIAPSSASGQSYADIVHMNECTRIANASTDALNHHQWESLVSLGRQFIGNCLDLSRDSKQEAETLNQIAIGLDNLGKFDDAIPVLGRGVRVKPDAAYCYAELGAAFEGQRELVDARKAFEQAIS